MGPTELGMSLSRMVSRVARKTRRDALWQEPGVKYSVWHVVRVFITCVLEGVCPGTFYERLRVIRGYRQAQRLPNRLISVAQLKKRMKTVTFQRALLEIFRESAVGALRSLGSEEVRIVAMDLTRLESDPDRDRYGAWGKDSSGPFWGYKLGLIMSQNGVVLGMTLMKGNWNEFKVNRRLIRMAKETIQTGFGEIPVEYLVCDAGFDGEPTYRTTHQHLQARVICPRRRKRNPKAKSARNVIRNARSKTPHREADVTLYETPEGRELFKKRSGVERLNPQLKDTGIRISEIPPHQRGVRKLWRLCLAKLIIYNIALNVNIAQGRPLRSLKVLAA